MKRSLITSLLYSVFVSLAVAQRGNYGGRYDDGGGYREDYNNDNMYTDYAKNSAVARRGGGGWVKVVVAGVGGCFLGAQIQSMRLKKSLPQLRFKVKQRVECNMGSGDWTKGTVVRLWSQREKGVWTPYEVLLDDEKGSAFAPADDDMVIRAYKGRN